MNPLHEATEQAKKSLSTLLREGGPSQVKENGISKFVLEWNELEEDIHELAKSKGWWDNTERNKAEAIALMHAELSEALEALREPAEEGSEKAIGFNCVEEELADVVIRIMDFARGFDYDVAGAIEAKIEHNRGRPYRHGHKKF